MNGYLLANEMGKRLFQEWAKNARVARGDLRLGHRHQRRVTSGTGPDAQQAAAPIAPPTLTATKDSSPLQLTLRIISGHVEATWLSEGKPQRGEDALPTELPEVDAAQAQVWSLTKAVADRRELAKRGRRSETHADPSAHSAEHSGAQLGKARDAVQQKRPLEIRLDFASSERHAHYSWELLREPSQSARPLSTIPNVFITRPFASHALLTLVVPSEKKLLLVLAKRRGRPELERVKALWDEKGLLVTTLNRPKSESCRARSATARGTWFISSPTATERRCSLVKRSTPSSSAT
jgi:hypothetical protein